MMTDVTQKIPGPTPRGVKIALAISVAINLGVAGLVAGMALHGGPGHGDRMGRDLGFGPFDAVFSPQDRTVLRQTIAGKMGDFRQMRQQMQGDMAAILSALRANPYDAAAVATAFDLQAQHLTDRVSLGNAVVRDYIMALPGADRLALADRLEKVIQHGPDEDGKDK
jgi:uncharacterized membrane protein